MAASSGSTLHIYTRVSTIAQADKGTSLISQLELGTQKAQQLGFDFVHWDEGGKSSHHEEITQRPVLAQLYAAIQSGQVKHLWVYDQSRLSRNDQVASIFRYECNKQGVTLYTKDGQFDLSTAQDKFLKQLLDAVAEFDNTTRAERTRLGKLQRVRQGHWHGGPPPYGYSLLDGHLVIDPEQARWVRTMFELSASGLSPAQIKQRLDASQVLARRGKPWSLGSIAAMLRNTHYCGQYTYTDNKTAERISVACPSIVEPSIWQTVQVLHRKQGSRHSQNNATKHFYLLRDFMYCGHCGRPMSARQHKGNAQSIYFCPNKSSTWVRNGGKSLTPWQRGTGCGFHRHMNLDRADELIWRYVQDLYAHSSLIKEELKRYVLTQQGLPYSSGHQNAESIEKTIARLQRKRQAVAQTMGHMLATALIRNPHHAQPSDLEGCDFNDETTDQTSTLKRLKEQALELDRLLADLSMQAHRDGIRQAWLHWLTHLMPASPETADPLNPSHTSQTTTLTDEQRKAYIRGIVDKITVRWIAETSQHEITLHLKMPIANDALRWIDPARKSLGYTLVKGQDFALLNLTPIKKNSNHMMPHNR